MNDVGGNVGQGAHELGAGDQLALEVGPRPPAEEIAALSRWAATSDTGDRAELEISRLLADQLGLPIRRKLGAGRTDDSGDLDGLAGVCAQVKNYRNITTAIGDAMHDLPDQKRHAGAQHAVAFVRRPGGRWIAVMSIDEWCGLYREAM